MDKTELATHILPSRSCSHCQLGHLCLPRACSFQELGILDTIMRSHPPYSQKQRIFSQGGPFRSCYVVKSGSVKTVHIGEHGQEKVLAFYTPSEMFGFDGIYSDCHTCTAIALERTTICHISFRCLEQLALQLPSLQHWIFRLLSHELYIHEQMNRWLSQSSAEERVVGFLLDLSARYGAINHCPTHLRLSMPRSDVSNYLGLAIETVSRVLTRLQRERLIRVSGRVLEITDMAGLVRLQGAKTASLACNQPFFRTG